MLRVNSDWKLKSQKRGEFWTPSQDGRRGGVSIVIEMQGVREGLTVLFKLPCISLCGLCPGGPLHFDECGGI